MHESIGQPDPRADARRAAHRPPAGDEALRLSGTIVVAATPPIDPSTNGIRLVARDPVAAIVDVTLPGGSDWTAKDAPDLRIASCTRS
jgi:hypothetical protein